MRQGFRAHRDPCETARIQLGDEKISKLGFPMKILDPKGETINEVVSIDTRPKLDGKLFELPKDYSRTTVKEMMEGMRKEMESAREKIEQMMKDMSPEERAQMQQMMKQFGNTPTQSKPVLHPVPQVTSTWETPVLPCSICCWRGGKGGCSCCAWKIRI